MQDLWYWSVADGETVVTSVGTLENMSGLLMVTLVDLLLTHNCCNGSR